mmetsp:Transcript_6283/g.7174  ORF Transcript_6283/g.7174 Transcript_6283/m.7174 type:complete len:114 (+) Transcript_6283:1362-1703(+)
MRTLVGVVTQSFVEDEDGGGGSEADLPKIIGPRIGEKDEAHVIVNGFFVCTVVEGDREVDDLLVFAECWRCSAGDVVSLLASANGTGSGGVGSAAGLPKIIGPRIGEKDEAHV